MDDAAPQRGVAALGPEERLQHALEIALRHLARRERTEHEVRARLTREEIDASTADAVLADLERMGAVDDAGYARRFTEDRRALDGWGAERIERRLRELGIPSEIIAAQLAAGGESELERAVGVLRARLTGPPRDERERDRALGLLARRGYGLELAYDAVRAFEREQ